MREDILKALAADEDEEQKLEQISNVINLYGGKRDSLIQILHLAQEIYGYLPLGVQKFILDIIRCLRNLVRVKRTPVW